MWFFGIVASKYINYYNVKTIASHGKQKGIDSSGAFYFQNSEYNIIRDDTDVMSLMSNKNLQGTSVLIGHSSSLTDNLNGKQLVIRNDMVLLYSGVIVNDDEIWDSISVKRLFENDSEAVLGLALHCIDMGIKEQEWPELILSKCKGIISAVLAIPKLGKLLLFSNNGSLYTGKKEEVLYFSTESYPLRLIKCDEITQIGKKGLLIDIPIADKVNIYNNQEKVKEKFINTSKNISAEESMLQYYQPKIKRCTKCLLTETMPFISFDEEGVCNYCRNYKLRNVAKPKEELFDLVKPYRKENGPECIVPLSGGRDSCYSLHLIVNELKMKPITYTYDWGMITDLGRRNISRMCSELGV